jgi:hypothetical protein
MPHFRFLCTAGTTEMNTAGRTGICHEAKWAVFVTVASNVFAKTILVDI